MSLICRETCHVAVADPPHDSDHKIMPDFNRKLRSSPPCHRYQRNRCVVGLGIFCLVWKASIMTNRPDPSCTGPSICIFKSAHCAEGTVAQWLAKHGRFLALHLPRIILRFWDEFGWCVVDFEFTKCFSSKKVEHKKWCQRQKCHLFSNFNAMMINKEKKFKSMTKREVKFFLWIISNYNFFLMVSKEFTQFITRYSTPNHRFSTPVRGPSVSTSTTSMVCNTGTRMLLVARVGTTVPYPARHDLHSPRVLILP
jgi:hypothetical protein